MSRINWRHTGRFCCAAFSMDVACGMFIVALPYAAMGMGAQSLELGALGALRGMVYALACVAFAPISDTRSRKKLTAIACVSIVIVFSATAASTRLWQIFLMSALSSLGLALFWPPLYAWLGDTHRRDELAPATGAVNICWSTGLMTGGLVAGWLFEAVSSLAFLFAGVPAIAALVALRSLAQERAGTAPRAPRGAGETRLPGTKRRLLAAYLGSVSICCLIGVMTCVFPKLGSEIGVTSSRFGLFVFGLGLARTLMFGLGLWLGERLRRLRYSGAGQLLGAGMVATVSATSSHAWLGLVFVSLGFAFGTTFYRGLYVSLEAPGRRGLKSGMHEAALLGGILLGSVSGGVIAHVWGLRAPYVPLAGLAVVLVVVQLALAAERPATEVTESTEAERHGER